jgi:hypothetical protein
MAGAPVTIPKLSGAQDVSAPSKKKAMKPHIFKALNNCEIAKNFIGPSVLMSIVTKLHEAELDYAKFDQFVAEELDTTMQYLHSKFSKKFDENELVAEFLENFNEYQFQEVQPDPMGGAALGLPAGPGFGSVFGARLYGNAFYGNAAAYGSMGFPSTSALGGAYGTPSVNTFDQPVKTEPAEDLSSGGVTPGSSSLGTPMPTEPQETLMRTTFIKNQNNPNKPKGLFYRDVRVSLTQDDEMAKFYMRYLDLQSQKKGLNVDKEVKMSAELIALKAQIEGNEKNYRQAHEAKQSNKHDLTHANNKKHEFEAKLDALKKQQTELEAEIKKTTEALQGGGKVVGLTAAYQQAKEIVADALKKQQTELEAEINKTTEELQGYTHNAEMYGGKVAGLTAAYEKAKEIVEGAEHTAGHNKLVNMLKDHQAAVKRFQTNDKKKQLDQEYMDTLTNIWNLKVKLATRVQGKYPKTPDPFFVFHFHLQGTPTSWVVNLKGGDIQITNSTRANAGNWQCASWNYWFYELPKNERNVAEHNKKGADVLENGGESGQEVVAETPRNDKAGQAGQAE